MFKINANGDDVYVGSTLIINLTLVTVYKFPASMSLQGAFQCQRRFDSTTAYYSATDPRVYAMQQLQLAVLLALAAICSCDVLWDPSAVIPGNLNLASRTQARGAYREPGYEANPDLACAHFVYRKSLAYLNAYLHQVVIIWLHALFISATIMNACSFLHQSYFCYSLPGIGFLIQIGLGLYFKYIHEHSDLLVGTESAQTVNLHIVCAK